MSTKRSPQIGDKVKCGVAVFLPDGSMGYRQTATVSYVSPHGSYVHLAYDAYPGFGCTARPEELRYV